MPSYSHNFVKGGQTRPFVLWVLLHHFRLDIGSIPCEVAITVARFHFEVSRKQAQRILRQGNGLFWDFQTRELFMEIRPRVLIHRLIWKNKLAPIVKKSVFAMPWEALPNLAECRAHMSRPVLSKNEADPTARAYAAKCLSAHICTVTRYRQRLEAAGYLLVQENFSYRYLGEGEDPDLQPGEFMHHKNPLCVMRRRPDTLFFVSRRVLASENLRGEASASYPLTGRGKRRSAPLNFVQVSFEAKEGFSCFFLPKVVSRAHLKPLTEQSQKDEPCIYFDHSQQRWLLHRGQVEFCRAVGAIKPLQDYVDGDGWDDPAVLPQADPRAKAPPREWDKVIPVSTLDYIDRRAENFIGTLQREDAPAEQEALV